MVGKLLSLDLKEAGVIISIVHPGFMRTEMTAGVGFDKYWDDGGAVMPDEAAQSMIEWTKGLDMSKSGQYWAPRGPSKYTSLVFRIALMFGRGYWDRRCDHRNRAPYSTTTSMVNVALSYC
jgi:NAD(P)-dependent dehydrogenase (short-subunit alcohol dehydrogenase family)